MKIGEGTVGLVTGGASGLGEAAVRRLHSMGASITIADLDVDRMAMLKSELKDRVLCVRCDVTKEHDVKVAFDEMISTFGIPHFALACAGIAPGTPTMSLNTRLFEKIMAINLHGSVYMAKYAAIAM